MPGTAEPPTCRICWGAADSTPGGRLIAPCRCTGSVRHVHEGCLAQWQAGPPPRSHCEICLTRFRATSGAVDRLADGLQAAWNVVKVAWPVLMLAAGAWQGVQKGTQAAAALERRQRARRARQQGPPQEEPRRRHLEFTAAVCEAAAAVCAIVTVALSALMILPMKRQEQQTKALPSSSASGGCKLQGETAFDIIKAVAAVPLALLLALPVILGAVAKAGGRRAALLAAVGSLMAFFSSSWLRQKQMQAAADAANPEAAERRRLGALMGAGGSSSEDGEAYSDAHSEEEEEDEEATAGGDPAAAGLLTRSDINLAAWGALLGGYGSHWTRLCDGKAGRAAASAKASAAGDARGCCRPPRANLKGSGLLIGGHEVLVVDYLHYDLATHEEELQDLCALLERLGRQVFLRGRARPRFRLYYDPSDDEWGFVDCMGMLWLNAARDRCLLPSAAGGSGTATAGAPGASSSAAASAASSGASTAASSVANPPDRRFDRRRAEAWFLAACHLLAHHWGAEHGPAFEQRCGRVALRFHARLAAAFPSVGAA
ncbi:hypothetical protein ABPG75_000284 [Micractinium tetrahymenae]